MTITPTPALPLLDELDELRAKATRGPWSTEGDGVVMAPEIVAGMELRAGVAEAHRPDAALIVAEHNAVPKLTAALRAVLAVLDDAEARNERNSFRFHDGSKPRPDIQVDSVRSAITTALEAS